QKIPEAFKNSQTCMCGIANMCVSCLRSRVDISEAIPKQVSVHFCRQCERYLQPPGTWLQCALESRELLALCLKKLKASMAKVRLIDAGFLWTEPHSKRIMMKLSIQKEVMNGAILQKVFMVEFLIQPQMCEDCHRVEAKDFWKAVVQVRQKTVHKKTFYYLEQLILKHKLHQNTVRIKEIHEGIDFYYASKQHAQKMVDFLCCLFRSKASQRLISHEKHLLGGTIKNLICVLLFCFWQDNVVCLSPRLAQSLGNMGQVCVLCLISVAEVDGNTFWRHPFSSLCSPRQLEEFIVMDLHIIRDQRLGPSAGLKSSKVRDVWVQKTSEMDSSHQYHCRTFLGHLLNIGDLVLGFDFANANINDEFLNKMNPHHVPDVVRQSRVTSLQFSKLKCLHSNPQYTEFLEDLEEDEMLRKNVSIFRDASKVPVESETDEDGAPRISLMEMMEDLSLSDATGGAGAEMMTD
uniref:60S ribosomal export protein NMD3 n=1 Tax=Cyprinus carpio TaxID=7962 RepID=A0A8C2GES9_CYPCA